MLEHCVTGTPPWFLRLVKVSTNSELHPKTLGCLFCYLRHPFFRFTSLFPTQSVRPPVVTYPLSLTMQHQCSCRRHATVTQCFPPNRHLEKQRISLGGCNHSNHMPLLIYLVWLQPIRYNPGFVFIHVKLINIFACTTMDIIFWDFLILYQIFFSPQVKRSVIVSN